MTLPNLDELDRVRFAWPEPLVIDLLGDHYATLVSGTAGLAIAKLHQRLIRSLVENTAAEGEALRGQLVTRCRASGLDVAAIAKIETAVFFELMSIVGHRFRNSPRLRDAYAEQLKAALSAEPVAPVRLRPAVRPASTRPAYVRPQIRRWRGAQAATV